MQTYSKRDWLVCANQEDVELAGAEDYFASDADGDCTPTVFVGGLSPSVAHPSPFVPQEKCLAGQPPPQRREPSGAHGLLSPPSTPPYNGFIGPGRKWGYTPPLWGGDCTRFPQDAGVLSGGRTWDPVAR